MYVRDTRLLGCYRQPEYDKPCMEICHQAARSGGNKCQVGMQEPKRRSEKELAADMYPHLRPD